MNALYRWNNDTPCWRRWKSRRRIHSR